MIKTRWSKRRRYDIKMKKWKTCHRSTGKTRAPVTSISETSNLKNSSVYSKSAINTAKELEVCKWKEDTVLYELNLSFRFHSLQCCIRSHAEFCHPCSLWPPLLAEVCWKGYVAKLLRLPYPPLSAQFLAFWFKDRSWGVKTLQFLRFPHVSIASLGISNSVITFLPFCQPWSYLFSNIPRISPNYPCPTDPFPLHQPRNIGMRKYDAAIKVLLNAWYLHTSPCLRNYRIYYRINALPP